MKLAIASLLAFVALLAGDVLSASAALDYIDCRYAASVVCRGTPGNDTIDGTDGTDVIEGRGGKDVVRGYGSADSIKGGQGADQLMGGPGRDYLWGGHGADILWGGRGNDSLHAGCFQLGSCPQLGEGIDALFAGSGNDIVFTNNGKRDHVSCGPGVDIWLRDGLDREVRTPTSRCETKTTVSGRLMAERAPSGALSATDTFSS